MFIFKRNSIWYIEYVESGKKKRISCKTKSKPDALKFLSNFKEHLKKEKVKTIPALPLTQFQDIYHKHLLSNFTKEYALFYKVTMKSLMKFTGDIQLNSLNLNDFQKYFNHFFAQKRGYNYYRTLKVMMKKAIEWGYYDKSNPLDKIKLPKRQEVEPHHITLDEFNLIMSNVTPAEYVNIYTVLYYSGMRSGEISKLKWSQIDFDKDVICLNETKSKRIRYVPIHPIVLNIFNNTKRMTEYVFVNKWMNKIEQKNLSLQFKSAVKKTKEVNQDYHLHSLRSSFASSLANKNVSIQLVSKLLGHSTTKITEKFYMNISINSLIDAVSVL